MDISSLKNLIRTMIEEEATSGEELPTRSLAENLKNEILDLGREYNSLVPMSISNVKKLNISEFPQIDMMMAQLYLKDASYDFKKVFTESNDITFDPSDLMFTRRFQQYLEEHAEEVMIKVVTSVDKEFLIFISPVLQVEHIWEFLSEVVEAQEESEDEDEEPEEDEEF